jgi:predicted kinase
VGYDAPRDEVVHLPSPPTRPEIALARLIVLVGLPASGKSTYARELVAQGYTRVNRDELRVMLHAGIYSPDNEEIIKAAEAAIISSALRAGHNVVIDDTNMSEGIVERWFTLARDAGVSDYSAHAFEIPIEECIARDAARPNPVGEPAIRRLALGLPEPTLEEVSPQL